MPATAIALFWHQHQPYYPDDVSGETLMPWVRLHGVKDYWGMAMHLLEVPEFRCTINLVPSLVKQLQRYTELGLSDRHLDISRIPSDSLSAADGSYLLDQFFMCNFENMVRPFPRYLELFQKRNAAHESPEQALPNFSSRDLRDLQVWNNLTWFHPLVFERDTDLRELRAKGRNWTESEKLHILSRQMDVLREVLPLHKQLADSGQVELTTTPFYHPILPLLLDKRSARQAMPECALPKFLESYPGDARQQVQAAIELHTATFGSAPTGMWPAEGSVSQDIIPLLGQAGIEWIATDEEILSKSTNGWISRDGQGLMRHPEMLYRPWRLEEQGHSLQIVFRDHGLSDLIGFHYQRSEPIRAANDMLGRVEAIGRAVEHNNAGKPALVSIILDGENCWEYYPDGGVEFLRTLYRNGARNSQIRPVKLGEHLREHPGHDRIGKLFAGSWINHNFAIWIGHQEDNTGWDLLHQTRQYLTTAQSQGNHTPHALQRAWDELHIAEGSDWFWWFGDDHSSAQDDLFDQLFRKHLINVYLILGVSPPAILGRPITQCQRKVVYTEPQSFLNVKVNGRRTYFKWIGAGHYVAGNERGTMTLVTEGIVRELYFGFDLERILLRVDTAQNARRDLARVDELRIGFSEPGGYELRVGSPGRDVQSLRLFKNGSQISETGVEFAAEQIAEAAIPFASLGLNPDDPVQMHVELWMEGSSTDRAPRESGLEFRVPGADFEQLIWEA